MTRKLTTHTPPKKNTTKANWQSVPNVGGQAQLTPTQVLQALRAANPNVARPARTATRKVSPGMPTNHYAKWTDEERGILVHNFARGASAEAIAADMGRTASAICAQLKELGVLSFNKDEMTFYRRPVAFYKAA